MPATSSRAVTMRNAAPTVGWKNGEFTVGGKKDTIKEIKEKKLALARGAKINGLKDVDNMKVDESHTVVINGADTEDMNGGKEVLVISSDEEESSEPESSSEGESESDEEEEAEEVENSKLLEAAEKDHDMADESSDEPADDLAEPSFGELVQAQITEPIDVQAAFAGQDKVVVQTSNKRSLQAPDSISLGTVICQALRTNDVTLLESCLHTTDLSTIRSTIERLDSPLATVLLSKLAERLHRRPGRAGTLMVWVQWTLVSHGGYLATQHKVIRQLNSLNRVIAERVAALQPLLALKGKLDMLEAQSQLRKSIQDAQAAAHAAEEDDEEGVIYVEGQEEEDSEPEAVEDAPNSKQNQGMVVSRHNNKIRDLVNLQNDTSDGESEDDGDDMPTTMANGVGHSGSSDDEDSEDMIDDEAEETDASSDDSRFDDDEVDHDDDDDNNDAEESEDVAPPPAKRHQGMQRSSGLFARRR